MAIIHCPECDKKISSSVTTCPQCGYAIKKKGGKAILSLVFGVAAVLLVLWTIGQESREQPSRMGEVA